MGRSKNKAPRSAIPIPEAPAPPGGPTKWRTLSASDMWCLACLASMTAHLTHPPGLLEFANWVGVSTTAIYRRLTRLQALGYLKRDDRRRFVRTELLP